MYEGRLLCFGGGLLERERFIGGGWFTRVRILYVGGGGLLVRERFVLGAGLIARVYYVACDGLMESGQCIDGGLIFVESFTRVNAKFAFVNVAL